VLSSARALPAIADAVKGDIAILADSGIRNGLDVVRMIALGADSVLLGARICTPWRPRARRAWRICLT
jgi:L-lactate dehydrogenase (cytochrome)